MKKFLCFLTGLFLLFVAAGSASAYSFEDKIDTWYGADYVLLDQDLDGSNLIWDLLTGIPSVAAPFRYEHNINSLVNFGAGHQVTDASLKIGFTSADLAEFGDVYLDLGLLGIIDETESVAYQFDEGQWTNLGEVGNGEISGLLVDVGFLNDDGILKVTIDVFNSIGKGDIGLDYSYLSGNAVPEPATMLLFGLGLLGLAGVSRKKA